MLKAGAASIRITPPIGIPLGGYERLIEGVHDDLMAKALVLDNGHEKVLIVTLDLGGLEAEKVAHVRQEVERQTGIPGSNILICCTHSHSALFIDWVAKTAVFKGGLSRRQTYLLNEWLYELPLRIGEAAAKAVECLRETRVTFGQTSVTGISYNRRKKMAEGAIMIWTTTDQMESAVKEAYESWGMPPMEATERAAPGIPEGPIDPDLNLIRIEDMEGRPIAVVVNFACHAVAVSGYMNQISADYPGYLTRLLEETVGGTVLFIQGTAGDIRPYCSKSCFEEAERIGFVLASAALKAFKGAEAVQGSELKVVSEKLNLAAKRLPPTVEEAKKAVAEKEKLLEEAKKEKRYADVRRLTWEIEEIKCFVFRGFELKETVTAEVQAIRIGDIVLVALPGEVLVRLGLAIKDSSWTRKTLIATLANGSIGYIPNREEYEYGGYEPTWSRLALGGGEKLVKSALELIRRIR